MTATFLLRHFWIQLNGPRVFFQVCIFFLFIFNFCLFLISGHVGVGNSSFSIIVFSLSHRYNFGTCGIRISTRFWFASIPSSGHTYEWVTSGQWSDSCHTNVWVTFRMWMSHVTHMNEHGHAYEWVTKHVTQMVESCYTYGWVMLHIWMSHDAHCIASAFMSHTWMHHVCSCYKHEWMCCNVRHIWAIF